MNGGGGIGKADLQSFVTSSFLYRLATNRRRGCFCYISVSLVKLYIDNARHINASALNVDSSLTGRECYNYFSIV
jgi:hypothetical protein